MSPTLYERTDINCCRLDVQELQTELLSLQISGNAYPTVTILILHIITYVLIKSRVLEQLNYG